MSGPSDASAGGAGGAAGVGFQSQVFAWAASCVVAGESLLGSLVAGAAVTVGAQTGSEVDDVVVLTDQGNGVFIQAKIKLQLSSDVESPLAKGLEQAVRQYLVGTVSRPDVVARPVDSARDVVVLCTNQTAPATVRVDLAAAVSRAASHPEGTPLGDQLNMREGVALSVALAHIRRLWAAEKDGAEPAVEDLRKFLKCLRVLTLDVGEGGKDQQAAISVLHRGLVVPSQASTAWQMLVSVGQVASESRQWRDRAALSLALAQQGVSMNADARYATAIATIRDRSSANLSALQAEALLPVDGGLFIVRSVAKTLREVESRDPILLVGDAGSGKSGVLQDFATRRQGAEEVVILLAADVAGANRFDPGMPLQEVLRGWIGLPALLVIDGVDALRGSGDRETLSNTVAALSGTRWQVVASARSFDTCNSRPLQRAFAGLPVSNVPGEVHSRLTGVRHLLVGDLSDEDLAREIMSPMPLAKLLADAPSDLRAILRNPFNLRLAAELAASLTTGQHDELLRIRSRVELLGRYWEWRIRVEGAQAREALLRRLVVNMVASRRLQVGQSEPTVLGTDAAALEDLLSHGVLASIDGPISSPSRVIGFSHNILFDYAAAIYMLYDPLDTSGLVTTLDADPTLPLVARPSFDLLVDMLWQDRSSGAFWPTALAVAGSGHVLASLAVAARIANLATNPDDLLELATPDTEVRDGAMSSRQHLASQLTGAIRARAVIPNAEPVAVPLAHLARRLAENAAPSYTDGALAADLILALQSRVPIGSVDGDIGSAERAQAIALLLDACRSDPPARERLAGALIRQVEYVVVESEEVRAATHRILDDFDALAQWGGTVTIWFPGIAAKALSSDPDLAYRLALTSMTFVEAREEDVGMGFSAVLPLRESRRQQAGHAAYRLAEVYPDLAARDATTATAIICAIVNHIEPTGLDDAARQSGTAPTWPMTSANSSGWIEHSCGFGLSSHIHADERKMLRAIAEALVDAGDEEVTNSLDLFVDQLHIGWAWAALMERPSDPARLFRVLFPAFASGTLLSHPNTYSYAAVLLKAAADEGTVPQHDLEAAVTEAIELLETLDRGDHIKDILVGCLNSTAIADEGLVARLAALGDEVPEIQSPPSAMAEARAWSTVDHILEEDRITLTAEIEAAARALDKALNDLADGRAQRGDLVARLVDAFVDAHAVFTPAEPIHERLDYLLLDGAVRLARESEITPEHPVAQLVLHILEAKAEHSDAGQVLNEMAWRPDMRDRAIEGLSVLVRRKVWRTSEQAAHVASRVKAALGDDNPVVRMHAAEAFTWLDAEATSEERVGVLQGLLVAESHVMVKTVLLNVLSREVHLSPLAVDTALEAVSAQAASAEQSSAPDTRARNEDHEAQAKTDHAEDEQLGLNVDIITLLGLAHETPFATRTLNDWASTPAQSKELHRAISFIRGYLAPGAEPRLQQRTFEFITTAAAAALKHWTDIRKQVGGVAEEAAVYQSEMKNVLDVCDNTASQIYFASGAFDGKSSNVDDEASEVAPTEAELARFAELATPTLLTCAASSVAPVIHHVVEALVYLAPVDEKRGLKAIAEAVSASTDYAYDSLASGVVVPYLIRLLAEQRELVLFDEEGVTAFRTLLSAFAAAGNGEALVLAFTFADVFR